MKKPLASGICIGLIAGISAGYGISYLGKNQSSDVRQIREGVHNFINPLLECELGSQLSNKKFVNFKQSVAEIFNSEKAAGNISDYALYYRDLNNGPWFGINEQEKFIPASLLKLPLSITFYKMSEDDSSLLQKGINYDGNDIKTEQYFVPEKSIEVGKDYTYPDLVKYALTYSDNDAALALAQSLGQGAVQKIYTDLALDVPTSSNYAVSVKDYATFFRVLFNASYLNQSDSEKILSTLSSVTFKKGIKQGLPNDIQVSHKFGEVYNQSNKDQQLHDCGIIYAKTGPYLLCVMTRGKNIDKLNEVIGKVSKAVFEEIK